MNKFRDPLDSITSSDIEQVRIDEVSEGLQFELKSDLPSRTGQPDDWHTCGNISEFARNQIAEEVVAFANTMGGVVLIGIEESTDHPHRATKTHPVPRVHEFARAGFVRPCTILSIRPCQIIAFWPFSHGPKHCKLVKILTLRHSRNTLLGYDDHPGWMGGACSGRKEEPSGYEPVY